jgi:hypothetical protein
MSNRWITTECQVVSNRSARDAERLDMPSLEVIEWLPVVFALEHVIGYRDDGIDGEPATMVYLVSGEAFSIRMSFVTFDDLHSAHRRTSA